MVISASDLCSRTERNLDKGAPVGAFFVDQNYLKFKPMYLTAFCLDSFIIGPMVMRIVIITGFCCISPWDDGVGEI